MDKFLIAGLGNIGNKFVNTRHNVGFNVIDLLAGKYGVFFSQEHLALKAAARVQGKIVYLIKSATYVNDSGQAVLYWLEKLNILRTNLLVVLDDKDLPFGKLKINPKGGDGRHNGLKSISESLGDGNYPRLRFGIGRNFAPGMQKKFVVSEWSPEESQELSVYLDSTVNAVECYITLGLQKAMTKYNS